MKTVQAYLDRICYRGGVEVSLETLQQLHLAHLRTVPYENIDIRLGKPVSLDIDDIFRKVVVQGRGGYCYELNSLFAWLLAEIGFEVRYLSTQLLSLYSDGIPGPEFEHMILLVKCGDNWVLTDVGHGEVFEMPMPLLSGIEQREPLGDFFLSCIDETWTLYKRLCKEDTWSAMYQFSMSAHEPNEFFPRHNWNQIHDKTFYKSLTFVARAIPGGGRILITDRLKTWKKRKVTEEVITEGNYLNVLSELFGINLPVDTDISSLLAPDLHKDTFYDREEYTQHLLSN